MRAAMARIAHLDPVTGRRTVDPRAGVRDDDFIHGIGVSGMKAGEGAEASP